MLSRRKFLGASALAAGWIGVRVEPALRMLPPVRTRGAVVSPSDETFWQSVSRCFNVDRSLIHLNTGGVCPIPEMVQSAEQANQLAAYRRPFYAHQGEVGPQIEAVRRALAHQLGCDAEEIALTRNTSEGMEICQLGIDLQAGDEVVTTEHDYPRMLNTWQQRVERDGIRLVKVPVAVPLERPSELVDAIEAAITSRTRLIMCCHMVDLTGQILPVRDIVRMAHRRGIPVLVDGAQTFGQIDVKVSDLGCDYFATSLHKWLLGPHGTGILYVSRDRIADLWPMMPCDPEMRTDIRKFEDVGTQSPARFLALGEALSFRHTIGPDNISARLRYLREYWLEPLRQVGRVRLQTHCKDACSLATIDVDGFDPVDLRDELWQRHRIRVRPIRHDSVRGIRVSAGLHNTTAELDRFIETMHGVT